MVIQTAKVPSP
ncbi:hypothetical protein Taro_048261 [Colocasia esculenta]|uniref:Uncharacterized protein n=1 Tax=Colocasia esculenta TaxID=4460 RepID=A0A843X2E6_COLES|nr:hypothetical protein [Colocasia esculenta]